MYDFKNIATPAAAMTNVFPIKRALLSKQTVLWAQYTASIIHALNIGSQLCDVCHAKQNVHYSIKKYIRFEQNSNRNIFDEGKIFRVHMHNFIILQ